MFTISNFIFFVFFLCLNLINFFRIPIMKIFDINEQSLEFIIVYTIFCIILYILIFSILISQYYTKIVEQFFCSMENDTKNAMLLCILNNIPKIIFSIDKTNIEYNSPMIFGYTTINLTFGLSLLLLCTDIKCFLSINFMVKEYIHLSFLLIHQKIYLQEKFNVDILMKISIMLFFSYLIYSVYMANFNFNEIQFLNESNTDFTLFTQINKYTIKFILDTLIIDIENFNKTSCANSIKIVLSPILNTIIFLFYFFNQTNTLTVLISLILSFIVGCSLLKCSKKRNLQQINFAYGLIASYMYIQILLKRLPGAFDFFSNKLNIKPSFLSMISTSMCLMYPELLNLIYFGKKYKPSLSIIALFSSIIFNSTLLFPLKTIFLQNKFYDYYKGNEISLSFSIISLIVIFFNYVMRNQKLSRDLGYIQMIIFSFYMLTLLVEYKKYVIDL